MWRGLKQFLVFRHTSTQRILGPRSIYPLKSHHSTEAKAEEVPLYGSLFLSVSARPELLLANFKGKMQATYSVNLPTPFLAILLKVQYKICRIVPENDICRTFSTTPGSLSFFGCFNLSSPGSAITLPQLNDGVRDVGLVLVGHAQCLQRPCKTDKTSCRNSPNTTPPEERQEHDAKWIPSYV